GGRIWAIKSATDIIMIGAPLPLTDPLYSTFTTVCASVSATNCYYPTPVQLHPEDLDVVPIARPGYAPPEGDLLAVDYANNRLIPGLAAGFANNTSDILITQEFRDSQVFPTAPGFLLLRWNAQGNSGSGGFDVDVLNVGAVNSTLPRQFEHVSFWGGEN